MLLILMYGNFELLTHPQSTSIGSVSISTIPPVKLCINRISSSFEHTMNFPEYYSFWFIYISITILRNSF